MILLGLINKHVIPSLNQTKVVVNDDFNIKKYIYIKYIYIYI